MLTPLCAAVRSRSSNMAPSIAAVVAASRYVAFVLLRFCTWISLQPHFDLEHDYIIRKPIWHRIQRCNLRREILSTFHTRVDHRSVPWSVRHFSIQINTAKISKNAGNHARNSPFPLRHVDFHLTHECLGWVVTMMWYHLLWRFLCKLMSI